MGVSSIVLDVWPGAFHLREWGRFTHPFSCLLGTHRTVPRLYAHRRQPTYIAAGIDTISEQQQARDCDAFMDAFSCLDGEEEVSCI